MITYDENKKRVIVLPMQAIANVPVECEVLGLPEASDCTVFFSDVVPSEDGHTTLYSAYINCPITVKLLASDKDYCDSNTMDIIVQSVITLKQTKDADTSALVSRVEVAANDAIDVMCAKLGKLAQMSKRITITPRYVGIDKRTQEHVVTCYLTDISA